MVLNRYRRFADRFLLPIALRLKRFNPNVISAVSLVFAILASLFFYFSPWFLFKPVFLKGCPVPYLLFLGSTMVFLNALFDALDGKIARITGKVSAVGDFLDHIIDRLSDVVIIFGLAFTPYTDSVLGTTTIIFMLIASYMGTQAQALHCGRNYHGIMGRAERLTLLIFLPPLQLLLFHFNPEGFIPGMHLTLIDVLMYTILLGSFLTAFQRGVETYKELKEKRTK